MTSWELPGSKSCGLRCETENSGNAQPSPRIRVQAGGQAAEKELMRRQEVCLAYAQHGTPGKAVARLVGPGLAPHSDATTAKMKSKFIAPPSSQATSRRPSAPPANILNNDDISRSIRSFQWGGGAGPCGCRPDFLRQVIGTKQDKPGLDSVTRLCNLLANGQASKRLRPFVGGACGFDLEKEAKAASDGTAQGVDARPV